MAEFDEEYSEIYDEIYASKDYQAECDFVGALHKRLTGQSRPRAVLDLGCGTGRHLSHFPSDAVRIGVDQSLSMVTKARRRGPPSIDFIHSTIGDFRNSQKFDLVYSLFHVVNYHVKDADLRAFFTPYAPRSLPMGSRSSTLGIGQRGPQIHPAIVSVSFEMIGRSFAPPKPTSTIREIASFSRS